MTDFGDDFKIIGQQKNPAWQDSFLNGCFCNSLALQRPMVKSGCCFTAG